MPIYIKYVYRYIFVVNRFRKNKEGESVENIKIGDIVTRNSDNNNILFYVEDIIKLCGNNIGNKFLKPTKNIKILVKNKKIFFTPNYDLP